MDNTEVFLKLGIDPEHLRCINLCACKNELPKPRYASFSGSYPFSNYLFPFDLAFLIGQKLLNFKDDVVGLVLPYPHGYDNEPLMGINRLDLQFLHLFNTGDTSKKISGNVNGIEFKDVEVPYNRRITLSLN